MPTTYAIPNGRTVMDVSLYTGNGSTQTITNNDLGTVGFKPDFVWIKDRTSGTANHLATNSVMGVNLQLYPNLTNAENSGTTTITSLNTNGFTLGSNNGSNLNGDSFVAWQWQAGQGTTSSNTSGTVTSTTSVNATAGFSVVSYTNQVSTPFTVGHGLGVAPAFIIQKIRSTAGTNWNVYHQSLGATKYVLLNTTDAATTSSSRWNDTAPTSTVFTLGSSSSATSTAIAHCWAEVAGFSKFGSYTGNGSADGPFVYTGFRPKFILYKNTTTAQDWVLWDTSRNPYNAVNLYLLANTSGAEGTATTLDILSNGFKLRASTPGDNQNGSTFIYAAFAENPFKYANAR